MTLLCFPCLCLALSLPPYSTILAWCHKVHLVHLAAGGLLMSLVSKRTLALVSLCKSRAPIEGSTAETGLEAWCKMVTLIMLQVGKVAGLFFCFPFGLTHLLFND